MSHFLMNMKGLILPSLMALCTAWGVSHASSTEGEWSRFRGPNGTGISPLKGVPATWTPSDYQWTTEIPGAGHSSPVLWKQTLFLTSSDAAKGGLNLFAVDAKSGAIQWKKAFPLDPFRTHKFNSFASSTPVVDENRVYLLTATPDTFKVLALDHSGNEVWTQELGGYQSQHGIAVSPVLYKDLLIVANDQLGPSFLVAFEAATGKERWRTARKTSDKTAYSTPCVYQPADGPEQLIFNSFSHGISGVDPVSGETLWEYGQAFDKRSVSSPVIGAGGVVIGSCGSGGGGNFVTAVLPGDPRHSQQAKKAWQLRRSAPYVPTGIAYGDHFYLVSDAGVASCVRADTGEVLWQERIGGNHFASPVLIDGKVYAVSTAGDITCFAASPTFQILGRADLDELTHASPAVANGCVYWRTERRLLCLAAK